MALVDMTWGIYTLPDPDPKGITVREEPLSASRRALGGRMWVDVIDTYKTVECHWPMLSTDEYTALRTAYLALRYAPSLLTLPDGRTFADVICVGTVWSDTSFYEVGVTPKYNVTLKFEETLQQAPPP